MWTAFSPRIIVKNSSNGLTLQDNNKKTEREREKEENLRNEMAVEAL